MRRPVDVKAHFRFLLPLVRSHSAKPPLSPSFHPHSFVSDIRSVQVGCSRFSRCCYLRIDLSSHRFGESWAPGLSRSHLDSAVELGSSYPILRRGAYPFTVLFFFIAGLLSIASLARQSLGAYRIPPETGLLIPSRNVSRDLSPIP